MRGGLKREPAEIETLLSYRKHGQAHRLRVRRAWGNRRHLLLIATLFECRFTRFFNLLIAANEGAREGAFFAPRD
jgi:hypothetical protein